MFVGVMVTTYLMFCLTGWRLPNSPRPFLLVGGAGGAVLKKFSVQWVFAEPSLLD